MKHKLQSFFLLTVIYSTAFSQTAQFDPVEYVNPLMGTQSTFRLSNGNTYPAIGRPWGMNYWSPQTGSMGDGWMYMYTADKIVGFKQTHQPSPWMNDYGQFSIMPVSGKKLFREKERASWFSHKAEVSKPYYYNVYLADFDITAELTATERAASFQFTYPQNDNSYVVIDAFDKGSYIKVLPNEKRVIGYSTRNSGGVPANFKNYFVVQFDKAFASSEVWHDSVLVKDVLELTANHSGAIIGFKTAKGEKVNVRAASSFISIDQAIYNLESETKGNDFNQLVAASKKQWDTILGRVKAEGGSESQLRTFYSCLYRTVCFPQKHYEIDRSGKMVHYSPYNGQVLPGYMYAGTGFWDTFRALYPLLNFLYPSINKEMQEGLINDYKEGGFLPEWSSPGFRSVMVGNNSASVVADAFIKGGKGYDIETLYQALLHGANNEGPIDAVGRRGVKFYNELGYVPYDVAINENVARTLEYAYDDFAILQLGKKLNRPKEELAILEKRMMNYKNVFDKETGLMRGKNKDGQFQSPFNPFKWGDAFTEGNSWHYSWSVFHDMNGLVNLMGGEKKFIQTLDTIFSMPPLFDDTYYGFPIHEIREMQIMNMGQYAHGNQPIQHMTYLYNYAGQPWKTQYWVREVMNRMYKDAPDGYCGDEDNGTNFSLVYILCHGFSIQFVRLLINMFLGAPLFKKMTISFENGKQLVIQAPANNDKNRYVQSLNWNAKVYENNYVNHFELLKGGSLSFSMSEKVNKSRGSKKERYPYSYSAK